MINHRHFAVHQRFRRDNFRAKSLADCLMTEADTEYGTLILKAFYGIQRDACFIRCTRTGRDHQVTGASGDKFVDVDLVSRSYQLEPTLLRIIVLVPEVAIDPVILQ